MLVKYLVLILCVFNLLEVNSSYARDHEHNPRVSLENKLAETQSLTGNFIQTTLDDAGNILQESSGVFQLATPGYFYWEVTDPFQQKIIVRNQQVILIDYDLEQATIRSLGNVDGNNSEIDPAQLPVLLLTGARSAGVSKALDSFTITENENQFNLKSKTENNLVSSVILGFNSQGVISQLEFTNALDQINIIRFSKLVANQKLDLGIFHQEIPDGFDTVLSQE